MNQFRFSSPKKDEDILHESYRLQVSLPRYRRNNAVHRILEIHSQYRWSSFRGIMGHTIIKSALDTITEHRLVLFVHFSFPFKGMSHPKSIILQGQYDRTEGD